MHKLAFDSVIKVFHDFEPNLRTKFKKNKLDQNQ